jgi:outer membrane protein assembly factor BamB
MSGRLAGLLLFLVVLIIVASIVLRPYFNELVAKGPVKAIFPSNLEVTPATPEKPMRKTESTAFASHSFDWPQWRGPDRTNVSTETGLLQDWPKEGPPLAWQVDFVGEGYSTPTVAGGRVFVMGNRGQSEYVLALSEADGGLVWSATIGPIRSNGGGGNLGGPRCSPTVDGDSVYALGLNGDLVCLEITTGRERWRKDLAKDFGGSFGTWGYSESPLIDGDKVVCTPGGKDATLLALNKKNGSVIWKCPVPGGEAAGYASMIAAEVNGAREYIQFISGGVVGVDGDGKYLWRYIAPSCGTANCSTPLFHDGAVFAASSYNTGGGQARIKVEGDKVTAEQVYFTRQMKNHHGGMVLVDGYIYGADDPGLLTCLDWKTGKVKWSERKPGKGSIAAADGRLYFRNEGGPMLLVEANPEKYVEHGRFEQPVKSGTNTWPHPVIANGKLYLHDQQFLYCYDVKKK